MSYTALSKKIGRQACTVVELVLDHCQLTYGVAPCTAVLGVTGPQKCFNTRKTTQAPNAYAPIGKSYRFCNARINPPDTAQNVLTHVDTAPTVIDPGNGLGQRGGVTVTLRDFKTSDADTDPYFRTRSYYPGNQGTYFGKLLARNPYYQNRLLRIYSGFLDNGNFDYNNADIRTYFIQEISGPDSQYQVTITAKDVLKLADDNRSQAPVANIGAITAELNSTDTIFRIAPAGAGDISYNPQGSLAIDGEVMSFLRTGDIFTVVRGQSNTVAIKHSINATVQQCLVYTAEFITDVLYDLITNLNFAAVPISYIDKAAWDAEARTWLSGNFLSTVICQPVGITQLITEICQQNMCYIWWDERLAQINFRAIRPNRATETTTIDEVNNILKDSTAATDDPAQRLSEVYVYSGQIDPTLPLDRLDNYAFRTITTDPAAEDPQEYGESRISTITSRWFNNANFAQAASLGFRMLQRYRDNPKLLQFDLDAKDSQIWTGSFVTVTTQILQDIYGASPAQDMEVLSVAEKTGSPGIYTYSAVLSVFLKRYGFIGPNTLLDYTLDTVTNQDLYAWISNDNSPPTMSNGDSAYYII